MKKFILKTCWFVVPYTVIFLISVFFYSFDKGDLLRMGYIPNAYPIDMKQFKGYSQLPKKYTFLSEKHKKKNFKVLIIGDSFSEQQNGGYKDFLSQDTDVLFINSFLSHGNPIQKIFELSNGDFFERYDIQHVVLQSVERELADRALSTNTEKRIDFQEINKEIKDFKPQNHESKHLFFSNQSFLFLYNSFNFFTSENNIFNKDVYDRPLNSNNFFSNKSNKLLFFAGDYILLEKNNKEENIEKLNEVLNLLHDKLIRKNVKLIFLPSPDKYDMYYDYLLENKNLEKPLFFDLMKKQKKEYTYIDSKTILQKKIEEGEKDIYFYHDTHWSPNAAKVIASEIKNKIN